MCICMSVCGVVGWRGMGGSGAGGMCVHPCLCPCVYLCGCPSPKEDAAVIFHTFSPAFFFLFLFFSFFFLVWFCV